MFEDKRTLGILAIIGVLILSVWYMSGNKESFVTNPYKSSKELDSYYEGATQGIKDKLVDTMTCHKNCCGDQWPVPFDNLSADEIQQAIYEGTKPGPFVRTNMSCGNGIGGSGCPCIRKDPYLFLVNRGNNSRSITADEIEPTFLIKNDSGPSPYEDIMSPYEVLQEKKSVFVRDQKLNDILLGNTPQDISKVKPVSDK